MALAPWQRLSQSVVVQNPWWVYMRDEFQLPSGKTGEYHYVHTNGSSMVVPVMPDQTLLTVKQYRYLAGRESIEFPCGSVKDGASHDETARRELREETGYSAGRLRLLGRFNPYNGMTDEMCHVYLASHLTYVGAAPDETEEFELVRLSAQEVEQHIADERIWDGMTIAAWHIARSSEGVNSTVGFGLSF